MEDKYGKVSVSKNISWKLFERSASLSVTFIVTIVLARILDPSAFGLAAMVTVFVTLSNIFVTSGLGNALIQKKDADELDFSSMFWLNLAVSIVLYLVLFMIAPLIAKFYGYPQLSAMLQVLSLRLLIAAVNSIQCAYISKNMMFRHYFYSTLSSKLASGIVGIIMAITGFGVWALIAQSLSMILFETCILWLRVKWRPRKAFSWERVKTLYSFAWKIMFMSFVEAISNQFRHMLIGKKYSPEELAYYDKGELFPNIIVTNISSSLSAVMFPVLSNAQDDQERILSLLRRWISTYAYCTLPILMGFVVTAHSLITILLTDKWIASVPFLQLACGAYAAWIIEIPIRETIKSMGYANICLKMQVIKTAFTLAVLIVVMDSGVIAIAVSAVGCGIFNIAVSVYYGNKYIQYKPSMLLGDIASSLALNLLMGICVYAVTLLKLSAITCLVSQIFIGIITYVGISILFRNKNFHYCVQLLKGIVGRKA